MDKHTFKVGDRVFGQVCTDDKKVPGVFVKMGGYGTHGCIIRRDDGVDGIEKGLYWFADYLTTHDTDFQVGDWVRYEGIHPLVVSPLLEGKIGQIDYRHGDSSAGISQFHMQASGVVFTENLVKIQPPQEEKKMVIRRKHLDEVIIHNVSPGDVHYKGRVIPGFYQEITGNFYPSSEWEPVEEWVKIEVRENEWATVVKSLGIITVNKKAHDGTIYLSTIGWRPVK